jgi:hypothetical protein
LGTTPQRPETKLRRLVNEAKKDLALYCKRALRIVTKQAELVPLEFNFAQRYAHERLSKQMAEKGRIRAIVLKARQEGISTYVAARNMRRITLYPNQNAMVVADQKVRGATLFGIYDTYYRNLPDSYRPTKRYTAKGTQLHFDTPTGIGGLNSKINVGTANDKQTGRAAAIHALHASEVAWWDAAEDVWVGLAQSVPDEGSEIVIESTANGVGNFFHVMWQEAEAGTNGYIAIFLPWFIHEEYAIPVSPEQEEEIRKTLTPWERTAMDEGIPWEGDTWALSVPQVAWRRRKITEDFRGDERGFRQEFPSTPREAFLVSGNCFFDEERLLEYEEMSERPVLRGNLDRRGDSIGPVRSEFGWLRMYRAPTAKGHYVIFADTAEGKQSGTQREVSFTDPDMERGGRDFCSADVFDVVSRTYVAQLHGRMSPETFAEQLNLLGRYYTVGTMDRGRKPALIGVEQNHSSGESVLRYLKDAAYPSLYHHRHINRRTNKATTLLGWRTTVENRMPMLDEFAGALRDNSISLPNADTIRECYTFIRDDTGRPEAQEGCHDDRVISAAGALQMARHSRPPIKSTVARVKVTDSPTGLMEYV